MSGHTPGPMDANEAGDVCPDCALIGLPGAVCPFHAAAPELLEALRAADLMLILLPTRDEVEKSALEDVRIQNRTAIAKATGR